MSYFIVYDNMNYKIAKIVEEYKNNLVVQLIPDLENKKIKLKDKIYPLIVSNIDDFQTQVRNSQKQIDVELLAELIESTTDNLKIDYLADIYFTADKNLVQVTALLFALAENNTLFENCQDSSFRKYNIDEKRHKEEILLRQNQDKELFQEMVNNLKLAYDKNQTIIEPYPKNQPKVWSTEQLAVLALINDTFDKRKKSSNVIPDLIRDPLELINLIKFINKPDKQTKLYKAFQFVIKELQISPLEYFCKIGLIYNLPEFFLKSFLLENILNDFTVLEDKFSNYTFIDELNNLPYNQEVQVFSIDGESTTEIDDAFSVLPTDTGYTIGVHIAAPALDNALTDFATTNISTIYYPDSKITMLPNNIIEKYSLLEKLKLPVVSIYFDLDNEFNVLEYNSKLEIVNIKDNLRIEHLEKLFHVESLDSDFGYEYEKELKILYKFAEKLEQKRGKPSVNNLVPDYNFTLKNDSVIITPRIRGNPIDKLVSELMILANCSWGRMLTNAFIPAIYRVKQPNYPVKMTLTPDSHTGLNVDYYTWASSPLRRASDFINQHQIISLLRADKNYFKAIDASLLEVVDNFDSKYSKYLAFQDKMERYWSLVYLLQENIDEITATFTYKSNVQLEFVPIIINTEGLVNPKQRGEQITLKVYNINLIMLTFDFKILQKNI